MILRHSLALSGFIFVISISKIEPTPKRKQFGLKSSNYLFINCHDLKVVAIQAADIPGFSQILIFLTTFRSGLTI